MSWQGPLRRQKAKPWQPAPISSGLEAKTFFIPTQRGPLFQIQMGKSVHEKRVGFSVFRGFGFCAPIGANIMDVALVENHQDISSPDDSYSDDSERSSHFEILMIYIFRY